MTPLRWSCLAVLVAAAAWSMQSFAAQESAPAESRSPGFAEDLVSKLEVVDEPPWTETAARIRFTVENRGERPHRVLRLRPGWLEYNGGSLHGWTIRIEGPGGEYRLPEYSGLVPPPTEKDHIELAPGESYSTIIRFDEAARWDKGVRHPLPSTPGTYTVSIPFGHAMLEGLKFTVGGP
jgi:hypothetical protein